MRRLGLILYILSMVLVVKAQSISVWAPSAVSTGENFRIAYTVNTQNVEDFRAGNIPAGIEVIAGPYTSSQSSFQMVNGHTSSSSSITYTYTLYAEKAGHYTIPGARAKIGGHTVTSKPVNIKVTGARRQNGNAPQMHDDADNGLRTAGSRISGNDLFVRVSANKRRVHEQEPILLTYKVYTLVELTQLDGKMPDLTGFHTQEVKLPAQKSFHVEKVNGRNYRCVTWSQYVMYPQMTGALKIPSITFKGIVVQQNRSVDPLEAFFNGGSGYVEVKRDIVAPGLNVQVDPLPTKPTDFSGGVGHFSISAQADKTTLKAGNPVTIRVVVSGTGNLKLIKQPVLSLPKDFDKYDPKVTDKTRLTANGIEGSMVYDFLVVPRNQGKYMLPAISFVYYDTEANAYRTVKTQPIALTVEKGDGKSTTVDDYSQSLPDDILPIKTGEVKMVPAGNHFFASAAYWVCLGISILAFIILLIVFRKRAIDNADVVRMKGKKANKVAIRRLRTASKLMFERKHDAFYDEVLKALWGYVGDKLNMPVEQLSRENISDNLSHKSINQLTIDKFISALDECEFARYAPGDEAGNMSKTYEMAFDAIMEIENAIKQNKKNKKKTTSYVALFMLFLFMALLQSVTVCAVTKQNADTEYKKGNYQQAIADYKMLLKEGDNADVYFNLGDAYYRTDSIAQAVIALERAALLNPGDQATRFNLSFVRSKTIDKIAEKDNMFFIAVYHWVVNRMGMDGWAVSSVVAVIAMLVLLLVYLFVSQLALRKIGFYGAIVMFVIFLSSMCFAWQQYDNITRKDRSIVISSVVNVKKTPSEKGSDAFIIHEGTRLKITDNSMKEWCGVMLDDGREGWMKRNQMEII